jgi:hypothetical protein
MRIYYLIETSMKSFAPYFIALTLFGSCVQKKASVETMKREKRPSLNYSTVNRKNVKKFIPDLCDSFAIEFNGLYDKVDSLPLLAQDSVYVDNILVENGFTVMNSGGGNWQDGPRFIEIDLVRGNCYCSIYKKYYAAADGLSLTISERLICNTHSINAIER